MQEVEPNKIPTSQMERAFQYTYFIGEVRDMAVVALHSGANEICDIRDFPDYLYHCRYSEAEIVGRLAELPAQGLAIPVNGAWLYDESYSKDDPSFIF
jgi:hypothetical protein